ncbi:ribonuclease H-like domain-containing protein [Candidatus Saccharibacteria bacterium]|nr:ribonuclease H-like domain-containing protein [Candidatus Saccharibacteria bacterium]
MQAKRLVFDIEMTGEDFDSFDEITQKDLAKKLPDKKLEPAKYKQALEDLKTNLVFSPLTGKIVAIGVYDIDAEKGAIYYDTDGNKAEESEDETFKYVPMSEAEMLVKFWALAEVTDEFISFFGRRADVPYMMIRSAINGIRPTRDLVSNRYNSTGIRSAKHVDLFDSLTFYGGAMYKGSLHRWCRAFGIDSPKGNGMSGADVEPAYRAGKYLDIAKYNSQDLIATAKLYHHWDQYLRERN